MTEAAKLTGKQRQTIHKAIKKGRLSATLNSSREWCIDPSELFRVYPAISTVDVKKNDQVDNSSHQIISGLQRENELSLQRIADKDSVIDDLRRRLDQESEERRKAQTQLTALLTDMRPKAPQKPVDGLRVRLGRWIAGKP